MNVLTGQGVGTRTVLARAARLENATGRFTLADDVLAQAAKRLRTREEPLEVVLVVRDAAPALLTRLPGLVLAGVITEGDTPLFVPEDVALVAHIDDALTLIPEGEWVIVDAARGRIVVAPDAAAVARLQAVPNRPRVRLGACCLPARTLSGHEIAVWAVVTSPSELAEALAQGADGVVVWAPSDLLPAEVRSASTQAKVLGEIAHAVGGGALGLDATSEALDPRALVAVAARCQARWLLDPASLGFGIDDLRAELALLVDEERNADRPARMPLLVARAPATAASGRTEPFWHELAGYDELIFSDPDASGFDALVEGARQTSRPLRVWLGDDLERDLPPSVAGGAIGVIVGPHCVRAAKDLICLQE